MLSNHSGYRVPSERGNSSCVPHVAINVSSAIVPSSSRPLRPNHQIFMNILNRHLPFCLSEVSNLILLSPEPGYSKKSFYSPSTLSTGATSPFCASLLLISPADLSSGSMNQTNARRRRAKTATARHQDVPLRALLFTKVMRLCHQPALFCLEMECLRWEL